MEETQYKFINELEKFWEKNIEKGKEITITKNSICNLDCGNKINKYKCLDFGKCKGVYANACIQKLLENDYIKKINPYDFFLKKIKKGSC